MHVWRVWMVEVRAVEVGAVAVRVVAVRVVAVRAVAVSSAGTLQPPREAHRQSCLPLPCVLPSCDVHVHVHAPSRKTHTQRSRGDTPWEAQTSSCDVSCEGSHPIFPKEESSHLRYFLESQVSSRSRECPTLKPRHRLKAQRTAPHPSVNTNTEYSVFHTGKSARRAIRIQLVVFTCSHSRLERSGGLRSTALNVSRPMSVKCQSNGLDLRWARWN